MLVSGRWSTQKPGRVGRAQVMAIAQLIGTEFDGRRDLSGIGGVETGRDAAEFLLLGANSVQVCLMCSTVPGGALLGAHSMQAHQPTLCWWLSALASKMCRSPLLRLAGSRMRAAEL